MWIRLLSKTKNYSTYIVNLQSLKADTILLMLMQWKIKWSWGMLNSQTTSL